MPYGVRSLTRRRRVPKTHCHNGHALTAENTTPRKGQYNITPECKKCREKSVKRKLARLCNWPGHLTPCGLKFKVCSSRRYRERKREGNRDWDWD